jgi:type VI secretion system ImpM family protein
MIRLTGALGALGKLHGWEEYVTEDAGAPAFLAFDRWIADNMDAALSRGAAWPACYRRGSVHAFVFAPGGASPFLAGAIAPSHDRAGRNYPLFAGSVVEADAASSDSGVAPTARAVPLATLPLLLEELWHETSTLVASAIADGTLAGLAALRAAVRLAGAEDVSSALEGWDGWASAMRLDELTALLFGEPSLARLATTLGELLDAAAPHRGVLPPRTRLSLRLPLGRAGGAAVCFWLSVVERTLGWQDVFPSFFWTHDGDGGSLLLHLGTAPKTTLAQLWMPAPADDVLDLVQPSTTEGTEHGPGSLKGVVAAEGATVADLIAAL